MIYDVIVVGGGPAGLTTAIYTGRARLKTLVIEKENMGSLYMAHKIDNYPGFPEGISGTDLNNLMKEQAKKFNVEFIDATLFGFDPYDSEKIVKTDKGNFKAKAIVVATGTGKNFGKKIKGEKEFLGAGVSYCATCDGAFTRGRDVVLIGQGEELAEESLFLTKFAKSIKVFVTSDKFECEEDSLKALEAAPNVEIILNSKLLEIKGDGMVSSVVLDIAGETKEFATNFAFLYLGTKNNVEMYGEFASLDEHGNIIPKEDYSLNIDGMYATGDIISGNIKQVTVAVADGTKVALEITKRHLKNK